VAKLAAARSKPNNSTTATSRAWSSASRLRAVSRGNLSKRERQEKFAGHSLRAGLASLAETDECYVRKDLGHASAE
jgi:hypothetical protein